jgi:hypothetical protein
MASLSSPYQSDTICEVVPDCAKIAGKLSASSVITGRRRVRIVPQSGQVYNLGSGGASTVNIMLQDGQSYLDPMSCVLSFSVKSWDSGTAGNVCVPDDGAWSVFRRLLVSVNSTLFDDVDFLAKRANAELYASASQNWYDNVGSMLGMWKYSQGAYSFLGTGTGATKDVLLTKYNVVRDGTAGGGKVATWAKRVQSTSAITNPTLPGNKFYVPLSLLSNFFRNDTLLPLRNMGQLMIQLNTASALEATYNNPAGTPNVQISDLTLEADFVSLHPEYVSMMDMMMETPGEHGVHIPFDAHLVATQNITGGNTGGGQQSVIISKASQNLRSVQVVVQSQTGLSTGAFFKQSTFSNPGLVDVQVRIGSYYYPAFTSIGENRAFADLHNAFGSSGFENGSGLCDINNYYIATDSDGNLWINNAGTWVQTNTTATSVGGAYHSDCFTWAYCFDQLRRAKLEQSGHPDLQGVNTLTSSGSQIVVQLNAYPKEASVLVGIVRFTRVLQIAGASTRIIG